MKKRLTLLLTDEQIRAIKVQAAQAGLPANQWIIDQLDLADTPTAFAKQVPDVEDVSAEYLTAYGQTGRNDTALGDQDPVHIADGTPQEAQDTAQADGTPQEAQDTAHADTTTQGEPDPFQAGDDIPIDAQTDAGDDIQARDDKIIEIYESLEGRQNAQARADALNEAGVLIGGKTGGWTKKNAGDAYRKAIKRTRSMK